MRAATFGEILAEICGKGGGLSVFRLETEASAVPARPAAVTAVISRTVKTPGAPEWEQILSVGAACQNLLVAATALGYGAQWITEWYGYSANVRAALKLAENERVAGFVQASSRSRTTAALAFRDSAELAYLIKSW